MEALASTFGAPAAAVAAAYILRRTGAFTSLDGQTATKYVAWLTLPSLILQSFNRVPLQPLMLPVLGSAAVLGAIAGGLAWVLSGTQHPKERALLSGTAVGGSLALTAYPVVAAAFGQQGLRLALVWGLANSVAAWVASFLLFASAGAPFPDQAEHLDSGKYRGEWKGGLKEGYGIYTYPSGARYEGEWRDNLKEGRGVYYWPKGGVYEGEWRGGKMEGLGVRTWSTGKVKAGVWREGQLETALEDVQCSLAVEGANEAAAVARRVQVGEGTLGGALGLLLADPTTWAYGAALVLAVLQRPLTPTLDTITRQLAAAHAPLALLALGLSLDLTPPAPRQMREVSGVLLVRLLPPLLLAAAASAALGPLLHWGAGEAVALVAPLLICALAPMATQVQAFAYRFRLNESLAAALTRASTLSALVLMPLVAGAAALAAWASTLRPFLAALGAAGALVVAAASTSLLQPPARPAGAQAGRLGKVRMVYAGASTAQSGAPPQPGAASSEAAAATASVQPEAGSTPATVPAAAAEAAAEEAAAQQPAPPQQQQQQQPKRRSAFQDLEGPTEGATGLDAADSSGGATPAAGAVLRRAPATRQQQLLRQWIVGGQLRAGRRRHGPAAPARVQLSAVARLSLF